MAIFGSKYSYYGRVVPGRLVPPANCLMCHITSHYMAKHVSGPFVPSQCTLIALEGGLNKHAPKSSCYLRVVPVRWVPSWNCLMSHITSHCMATEWIGVFLDLMISTQVPRQYLNQCGLPNYDSQSTLAVWLHIGDSLLYHHATPYTYKYRTVDTYQDHGHDIRSRIELETPLSSLSDVQWSQNDIFRVPLGLNPLTRQGLPIVRVNLFDPQQTAMSPATLDELSSVTLGSFQHRLVRTYMTSLR